MKVSISVVRSIFSAFFMLCVSALLSAEALAQTDVHALANRVDAHYNTLQTLQADFVESYTGGGMSRTESGTLWLKRPGRMRWEYRRPQAKLFVTDGKTAWFYVPGERQARKAPVRKLDDLRSPLAYLLGRTKLEKEFSGLSVAPDIRPDTPGNVVLRGVPRRMGGISQVIMEITAEGRFSRLQALQEDGSTTTFRFSNQRENVPVAGQRFSFTPPHGVETVNADQLGQ
jgi:outer membrane lipoprotein carrier protein